MPQADGGMIRALMPKARLRLLTILYSHPDREFHASELIRIAGSGSGAVQRELERLTAVGLIAVGRSGNRKLYRANSESPIYSELHQLILKTEGLIEPIRRALHPLRNAIEVAFVYGSIAKGTDTARSDIDLMLIGKNLSYGDVFVAVQKAEKSLERPISPNVMTAAEWKQKLRDKKSFVSRLAQQPKLFIFGGEDELQRAG